jgi:four helix bundle protein
MHNHRKLDVWRRAHGLAVEVYGHLGPRTGRRHVALAEQLKRAVASIAANIAEGAGQGTDAQFARFLGIAAGSAREVDNHLALAVAIGLISEDQYRRWLAEAGVVSRQLIALQRRLRTIPSVPLPVRPSPSSPVPDPSTPVIGTPPEPSPPPGP